jgi:hypothetical protein
MRIAHLDDVPVVMHVRHDDETIIALPEGLSTQDILDLASLVLTCEEYAKLAAALPTDHPLTGEGA